LAKAKFDWHIDSLNLASQFLRAGEFADFPKMIKPFDKKEMEKFFLAEAKKLGKAIF
jgi:hypothetical protein